MVTPLIPFTLAWLVGIWLASRIALPTVATTVTMVGLILSRHAQKLR